MNFEHVERSSNSVLCDKNKDKHENSNLSGV